MKTCFSSQPPCWSVRDTAAQAGGHPRRDDRMHRTRRTCGQGRSDDQRGACRSPLVAGVRLRGNSRLKSFRAYCGRSGREPHGRKADRAVSTGALPHHGLCRFRRGHLPLRRPRTDADPRSRGRPPRRRRTPAFVATAPLNLVYIADLQTYEARASPKRTY